MTEKKKFIREDRFRRYAKKQGFHIEGPDELRWNHRGDYIRYFGSSWDQVLLVVAGKATIEYI